MEKKEEGRTCFDCGLVGKCERAGIKTCGDFMKKLTVYEIAVLTGHNRRQACRMSHKNTKTGGYKLEKIETYKKRINRFYAEFCDGYEVYKQGGEMFYKKK